MSACIAYSAWIVDSCVLGSDTGPCTQRLADEGSLKDHWLSLLTISPAPTPLFPLKKKGSISSCAFCFLRHLEGMPWGAVLSCLECLSSGHHCSSNEPGRTTLWAGSFPVLMLRRNSLLHVMLKSPWQCGSLGSSPWGAVNARMRRTPLPRVSEGVRHADS